MKLATLVLVALISFTTNAFADPDPNFYIFLCFGQSNMEGFPGVEQQDKTVDKRFQVLATVDFSRPNRTKGNWYDAVPPCAAVPRVFAPPITLAERWLPTFRRTSE